MSGEIEIKIVDGETVELYGQRMSKRQALNLLKELARAIGEDLFNLDELDEATRDSWREGRDEGFSEGYDEGHCDAEKEFCSKKSRDYECVNCGRKFCEEAIERLSDRVTPAIDVKDIANVLFEIYDLNEKCRDKKGCLNEIPNKRQR